jgi:hypothetical protein
LPGDDHDSTPPTVVDNVSQHGATHLPMSRLVFMQLPLERQACDDQVLRFYVFSGSASDSGARDLTAAQLTPAMCGQTADFCRWHWTATSGYW